MKTARILYGLLGVFMPIFIGALHTYAHFADLMTPEVKKFLQAPIMVTGQEQVMFNTWGVISFMMGAAFIVIGLLNFSILRSLPKQTPPPLFAIMAMILYLLCVIFVGFTFDATMQLYGGTFGLVGMLICLFLSVRKK